MAEGVGNAPTSAMPILFSRQVQPAYICLPSKKLTISDLRFTIEKRALPIPKSSIVIRKSNGARGRNLTLISDVRTIALYELSYASV